jgi:hypothetical protein
MGQTELEYWEDILENGLEDLEIPEHMHGAVLRYILDGLDPGHFLSAVIKNNLFESFMFADHKNIKMIRQYVELFYNYAPSDCWKSEEAKQNWIKKGGFRENAKNERSRSRTSEA